MSAKRAARRVSAYSKISATLETSVLERIHERSTNVSEYLNEAAKEQLYRDRLREGLAELASQGVRPGSEGRLERTLDAAVRRAAVRRAAARKADAIHQR